MAMKNPPHPGGLFCASVSGLWVLTITQAAAALVCDI